jgi:hypothetical protein
MDFALPSSCSIALQSDCCVLTEPLPLGGGLSLPVPSLTGVLRVQVARAVMKTIAEAIRMGNLWMNREPPDANRRDFAGYRPPATATIIRR